MYQIELILYKLFPAILLFCIQILVYCKGQFWDQTFYLCVADMKDCLPNCTCLQYGADSTSY